MKPPPFEYRAPRSLSEALSILDEHGGDAKILAGGQSLIPLLNFRLAQPAILIDLNSIAELDSLEVANDVLRIGGMTRQRTLERFANLERISPLLADAMPLIAHPQIRNRGTIGGSLAHADPAGELPAAAVALDAELVLESSAGRRTISAKEFFVALMTTALSETEIVVEVRVPVATTRSGWTFREISRRHGDYAHAGVAARLDLSESGSIARARLVYLSAGDVPMDAVKAAGILEGERPTEELFAAAAEEAAEKEVEPSTDIHATAAFKRHLVKILTIRALKVAYERAQAGSAETQEVH